VAGRGPERVDPLGLARSSGVLLHPTSLPGGRLGPEAYGFVDWLVAGGQSVWQVLPLVPPDAFGSPYAGLSAFAGSPALLADPDAKVSRRTELEFRRRHSYWIDDWLEHTGASGELATQVRFEREWLALRRYANARGIAIAGDLPLYVDRDSADVAVQPRLFDLSLATGVPPDEFSRTGQLWGSPPYRWGEVRKEGYRWWIERFRRSFQLFDATRLDHFRGFVAYWAVPHGNRTARRGSWLRGPGRALFDAVLGELQTLPVIAEDLGHITLPVQRLRVELGIPGMHILQWAYRDRRRPQDALASHREHAVVYTGTHDNDTAAGWWKSSTRRVRARVDEARVVAGIAEADPWWVLIELAMSSRSRVAIVQAQDVLGLGSEARMNLPATVGRNWKWRLEPGQLTADHAARLRDATRRWGRVSPGLARR
jgi:4-alpha-glucanotransferase